MKEIPTLQKVKSIIDGGASNYVKAEALSQHCYALIKENDELKAKPSVYCCKDSAQQIEELNKVKAKNESRIYELEQQVIGFMGRANDKNIEKETLFPVLQNKIKELYEQLRDKKCIGRICIPEIPMLSEEDFYGDHEENAAKVAAYKEAYEKLTDHEKAIKALERENHLYRIELSKIFGRPRPPY